MSLAVQSTVQQMFCGDEVKACVVDMGSSQCRFGFAGQDVPRYRFRSDLGVMAAESTSSSHKSVRSGGGGGGAGSSSERQAEGGGGGGAGPASRYVCGDQSLRYIRSDVDIVRPFTHATDGTVTIDWDAVEQLLAYGTGQQMAVDPREYPLLFAENDFRSTQDKNALLELAFETMEAPASWIASSAALAAFSSGRTCLLCLGLSLCLSFPRAPTKPTHPINPTPPPTPRPRSGRHHGHGGGCGRVRYASPARSGWLRAGQG